MQQQFQAGIFSASPSGIFITTFLDKIKVEDLATGSSILAAPNMRVTFLHELRVFPLIDFELWKQFHSCHFVSDGRQSRDEGVHVLISDRCPPRRRAHHA